MFKKLLIANRGEIAVRVIRTCKEMGIKTVAVFSEADRDALFVKYADESVCIGPPLSRKSYLNAEKIVQAAKDTGAEAIHPGYGFLAENAGFAEMCEDNGIKFIGPSAVVHRRTGEKIAALKHAKQVGVPVLPGSDGPVSSSEQAAEIAAKIGYPVIVKASGGGGGKGIKVAFSEDELKNLISVAKGEATVSFNNPDIFLEKYLIKPRHIEFQVIADEYGNCIHLGERECSIQRNYQKLVEEAPSSFLDVDLRRRMGEAAVKLMSSLNYVNAGTVEFLVDQDRNFYFNEINSRIQVEHPVTEMITGLDLVRLQIEIAAGGKLKLRQEDVEVKGWSIECRINAEDPANGFRPSPGLINELITPGGPFVRVDSALYTGYEVPPFYDSLLAKLVVWGSDRPSAIQRMSRVLAEYCIEGIKTTLPLQQKIMEDENFNNGQINTQFIGSFL